MKTKEYYGHPIDDRLPARLNEVHTHIWNSPGIDAPTICKRVVAAQWGEDHALIDLTGHELADWLGKWWAGAWQEVCEAIDYLLEDARITFSDDGELNCVR
jgi:hypothetical protein